MHCAGLQRSKARTRDAFLEPMPSRASLLAMSVLRSNYILSVGTSDQNQLRRCGIGLATSLYCDCVSVFDTGVPGRGVSTAIASEQQHGERGVDGVRARIYVTMRTKAQFGRACDGDTDKTRCGRIAPESLSDRERAACTVRSHHHVIDDADGWLHVWTSSFSVRREVWALDVIRPCASALYLSDVAASWTMKSSSVDLRLMPLPSTATQQSWTCPQEPGPLLLSRMTRNG